MTTKPAPTYYELYEPFFSSSYPELGSGPLSIEPYISPEYFELEREKIFSDAWMLFGHEADLPNPGDYFVKPLPIKKASILLTRATDGKIRAFYNVCPHRGNQLIRHDGRGHRGQLGDKSGFGGGFTCQFHSWSFGMEGDLKGVPEKDRFIDFDDSKCGLRPVNLAIWKGLLFINLAKKPAQNFEAYLGTLGAQISQYPFEKLKPLSSWTVDLKANWKVVMDAFSEGYHVKTVHKNVAPSLYKASKEGHNRMTHFKTHGRHRSMSVPKNPNFIPSKVEAEAFNLYIPTMMRDATPEAPLWSGLNPGGEPLETWTFDVNVIFPSTFVDISQGFAFTYEFQPLSVNETRYIARNYFVEAANWGERLGQELLLVQLREALLEDLSTIEFTQLGLESGGIEEVVLSDQELALRHHYQCVDKLVRGA